MQFYSDLYIGDSVLKIARKIKWKLKRHKHMLDIYIIVYSRDTGKLEFYNSEYLHQKYYKKNPPYIVGIAKGWEESCYITGKILLDIFQQEGSYKADHYFEKYKKRKV